MMSTLLLLLVTAESSSILLQQNHKPSTPVRLRVEYMDSPQGVDVPYPVRFTWSAGHTERAQSQVLIL